MLVLLRITPRADPIGKPDSLNLFMKEAIARPRSAGHSRQRLMTYLRNRGLEGSTPIIVGVQQKNTRQSFLFRLQCWSTKSC